MKTKLIHQSYAALALFTFALVPTIGHAVCPDSIDALRAVNDNKTEFLSQGKTWVLTKIVEPSQSKRPFDFLAMKDLTGNNCEMELANRDLTEAIRLGTASFSEKIPFFEKKPLTEVDCVKFVEELKQATAPVTSVQSINDRVILEKKFGTGVGGGEV